MASKSNDKQQPDLRFDLATLESMRTHDLAELMSNFVLLLRRLPNVPFSDLGQIPATEQQASNSGDDLVTRANERVNGQSQPIWWKDKQR